MITCLLCWALLGFVEGDRGCQRMSETNIAKQVRERGVSAIVLWPSHIKTIHDGSNDFLHFLCKI